MAEEDHAGRQAYRHYVREEQADEDASLSLMPPWPSDEQSFSGPHQAYRLGDEVYVIDEETGELVPLSDGHGQDSEALSPGGHESGNSADSYEWGDASDWSSADWESGSWDAADSGGEEGGG